MRLLITADTVGGVWTYTVELIHALAAHGVEAALATMGAPISKAQREDLRPLPNLAAVHESTWKLEWMEEPWEDVRKAGDWLLEIAGRTRPGIVHLNGYAHGALDWPAPAVVAGHSCVLSWWEAVHGEPAGEMRRTYREAVARGLRAAAAVAAPSRAMLASLEKHYGVRGGRVIPNTRALLRYPARPKREFVFAAGRIWDEGKNLRALAEAAERLRWPVCIAGEDRHPEGGRYELKGVRFPGRLNAAQMARCYAEASIYALPAKYEPFGLSVLEAAQAGCALVLGDIPSLRENWDGAAAFADPRDPDRLARELESLIENRAGRLRLQEAARRRAAQFPPDAMARAYMALYAAAQTREVPCAS